MIDERSLQFKKVSPQISQSVPEFIRVDHPGFVDFLEAYFEWLESEYSTFSPFQLKHVRDVDKSIDAFFDHFHAEFLHNFPKDLAESDDTGPLNKRLLIKKIKDFYQNKGTEKAFKFLFRVLFNSDVEVFLPKENILKASGGTWITQKSIRITNNLGTNIFKAINQRIKQVDAETNINKATARVERVVIFRLNELDVAELFLSDIQGTFESGFPIQFEDPNNQNTFFYENHTYDIITGISMSIRGSGHEVGERITISGGNGNGAIAEVDRIDANGGIVSVRMLDFGAGYTDSGNITVTFEETSDELSSGITAAGTAIVGALANHRGFYADTNGHLSSNKVLQDNKYYQEYSYVLKSEIVIERYRDTVKKLLHPAGFGFFGAISIKKCTKQDLESANSLISYELPLIGHYAPYELGTTQDLSLVYSNGYISETVTPGITLATPGHPRSDPYWIVYTHPNTRGITGITAGASFGVIKIKNFIRIPLINISCSNFK